METLRKALPVLVAAAFALPVSQAYADTPKFNRHHRDHDGEEEEHYRDEGAHPAKGRAGAVTLQSRALLDKQGNVDVELTTGQFDTSATPPGNIREVQIKAFDAAGEEMFEKEYEHLRAGGYFHVSYTGLAHGQALRIEAKVGGIDGKKEEPEIKLMDSVKYRPDLAVQKLDYPALARANTTVDFAATVAELMGDLGAHTDCVLLVDGAQVDAAKGIWVDARSVVTCRFSYKFTAAGKHTVTVRAQNVVPGDFDLSNNALSGEILIENPATMYYSLSVSETSTAFSSTVDYYFSSTSTVPDKHQQSSSASFRQSRYFSGIIPTAVNLPLKRVAYSDASGGVALNSLSYADVSADYTGASTDPAFTSESVIFRYDAASSGWLTVRRYFNDVTRVGLTTLTVNWDAGEVTYHSEGYCKSTPGGFQCFGGDYTRNTTRTSAWGTRVPLADGYKADAVVDDGNSYAAHPAMSLTPFATSNAPPRSCFPVNFGGSTPGQICQQFSFSSTGKNGYASLLQ